MNMLKANGGLQNKILTHLMGEDILLWSRKEGR